MQLLEGDENEAELSTCEKVVGGSLVIGSTSLLGDGTRSGANPEPNVLDRNVAFGL